jgi:hypothetical protein
MRISALFAFAALPVLLCAQQPAQPDWSFAHPDATLVGGIRLNSILHSPLVNEALAATQKGDPSTAAMVGMATGMLGGITEIRFSLLDNGTPDPDMVALISGKLDDAMLGMLPQSSAKYRRMDANTLLFGNGDSLDKAAARMMQGTPVLRSAVLAGTETLGQHDFWISGKVPDLGKALSALPNSPAMPNLNFRNIAFGLSAHDNVEMELALEAATAAMAQELLKSANDAQGAQPAQLKALLQSFVDGNTAHFRMNVPKEVALEALRTRMNPPALAAAAPPPAPAPAKRGTIRIEGLDSGPVEIPLQ